MQEKTSLEAFWDEMVLRQGVRVWGWILYDHGLVNVAMIVRNVNDFITFWFAKL